MVGKAKTIHESEMALFSECTRPCAQIELDTAGIVREARFRQLSLPFTTRIASRLTTYASMVTTANPSNTMWSGQRFEGRGMGSNT